MPHFIILRGPGDLGSIILTFSRAPGDCESYIINVSRHSGCKIPQCHFVEDHGDFVFKFVALREVLGSQILTYSFKKFWRSLVLNVKKALT